MIQSTHFKRMTLVTQLARETPHRMLRVLLRHSVVVSEHSFEVRTLLTCYESHK